jgi:hypothetical protein
VYTRLLTFTSAPAQPNTLKLSFNGEIPLKNLKVTMLKTSTMDTLTHSYSLEMLTLSKQLITKLRGTRALRTLINSVLNSPNKCLPIIPMKWLRPRNALADRGKLKIEREMQAFLRKTWPK